MPAIAFSNNDIALLAWTFDRHLEGCLGFAVYQRDMSTGAERPLPALARFASQDPNAQLTTADAPVQKFWWKDLYARRGGIYQYRIVPLGGRPGALAPLAGAEPLLSNSVTLTHERPPFKAYFNRGIVASQAVIHALGDKADINILKSHITDPADDLRARLMGQIFEGITSLLDRADDSGGQVHAALYELDDPAGLERRLQAKDRGNPKSRTVILGNERVTDPQTKEVIEDADAENRQHLKDAGVDVLDRILRKDSIPHNKFMVLSEGDQPTAVLTGSTNWTSSGLATQTNNVLVIESPRAAQAYLAYWNELKRDLDQAGGEQGKLQGKELRAWTNKTNGATVATPITLEDGSATVEPLFSPNTKATLKRPPKEKPNDMQRLFELVSGAKQAILFLAFDPGNNSILDAAGAALAKNPDLFVRGALTSTQRAANFRAALEKSADVEPGNTADMHVAVVGEKGKPRPKGKKGKGTKGGGERIEPDYRAIPAGSVTKNDAFGAWEAELYKYGHAIIHNKIVVIDPFSANCAVITGSHNLGYRASHNNDENLVIVRGHRPLAQAYACHVLDLYDHYAWRYWLQRFPKQFGKPLEEDDGWQERYIKDSEEKSPELRFWLSAVSGGIMPAVERGPQRPRSRRGMTSKSKSRSSKARTSRGARKPSTPRKKAGARKTKGHKAKAHKAKAHKTKARKAPKPAARRRKAARTGR